MLRHALVVPLPLRDSRKAAAESSVVARSYGARVEVHRIPYWYKLVVMGGC